MSDPNVNPPPRESETSAVAAVTAVTVGRRTATPRDPCYVRYPGCQGCPMQPIVLAHNPGIGCRPWD